VSSKFAHKTYCLITWGQLYSGHYANSQLIWDPVPLSSSTRADFECASCRSKQLASVGPGHAKGM